VSHRPFRRLVAEAWLVASSCAMAVLLAGCGGAEPSATTAATIQLPSTPSATDCDFNSHFWSTGNRETHTERNGVLPGAGRYRYLTTGSERVPTQAIQASDLPRVSEVVVTPSRRFASLACFTMQNRYRSTLANTETYVVAGKNAYLVRLKIQALGQSREVQPDPPILSVSGAGSSWSGAFRGPASGGYSFAALGTRSDRVGNERLRVFGLSSSVAYRGNVTGTQQSVAWISSDSHMVVAESVTSNQDIGVDDVQVHLHSRLISLSAQPLGQS
jgi:hypothetical protein